MIEQETPATSHHDWRRSRYLISKNLSDYLRDIAALAIPPRDTIRCFAAASQLVGNVGFSIILTVF